MSLPRDDLDVKRIPFQKPQQIIINPVASPKQNNSTSNNPPQKYFHTQTPSSQHKLSSSSSNDKGPGRRRSWSHTVTSGTKRHSVQPSSSPTPTPTLNSNSLNQNKERLSWSRHPYPNSVETKPVQEHRHQSLPSSRKYSQQSSSSQKSYTMSNPKQKPQVVATSGKSGPQQQPMGHTPLQTQVTAMAQVTTISSQGPSSSPSPHKTPSPHSSPSSPDEPVQVSIGTSSDLPSQQTQADQIISEPPPAARNEDLKTDNFSTSDDQDAEATPPPPPPPITQIVPPEKNVLSTEELQQQKQRHAEYKYKKKHNLFGNKRVGIQGSILADESEEVNRSEKSFTHWTPPNLEVLTDIKMVTVRQQEDEQDSVADIDMLGFDSHNSYEVFDETTTPKLIFHAIEKTDRQLKQKDQKRLYLIEIQDLDGEKVLTLKRSQASFMGDGIEITLADGTLLGGIRSGCTCVCCAAYFDVFDSSRTTLLYIEDRGWCSREFAVVTRQDKTQHVAYLSKRFLDNVQESRSDADVYLLEIRGSPEEAMSPAVKTLLMCAVFFIDFKYFEDIRIKGAEAKKKSSKKTINSSKTTSTNNKSGRKVRKRSDESAQNNPPPVHKLRNINAILNAKIEHHELMRQQAITKI